MKKLLFLFSFFPCSIAAYIYGENFAPARIKLVKPGKTHFLRTGWAGCLSFSGVCLCFFFFCGFGFAITVKVVVVGKTGKAKGENWPLL